MGPGPDHMGTPSSFTARRPNASSLPSFELPPPQLSALQQGYGKSGYSNIHSLHPAPTAMTLTSAGNLLTPPSNGPADALGPSSSSLPTTTSLSAHSAVHSFSPSAGTMWSQASASAPSAYAFQSRGSIFSPSLNSIVRANSPPNSSEGLPPPPPPYELPSYSSQSMSMSAPSLPAIPTQHHTFHNPLMSAQQHPPLPAVTHASPVHSQDAFARPPQPPTPSQSYYSHASTAQPASYSYSAAGPSPPVQHSPMTASSLGKISPMRTSDQIPSLHAQLPSTQYAQHRPYSYPMSGPVLSNVNNPSGQLALVGPGMAPGMMPFNSGHAAAAHMMYGQHSQAMNAQNDRPFRCDQCPQSFNRNHDLKRHKRIHLAVKPFPCGHCDKSFSRKDALKRHVLVKGCGKAHATTDVKELEGSLSPRSDGSDSAVVGATA